MSEEQKPKTVAEMKELSAKFKDASAKNLECARALDAEIAAVELAEKLAARDKLLASVSPRAKEVLKSSEVTYFINVANAQNYNGFADAALASVNTLATAAQNAEGSKISAFQWGRDRVSQLDTTSASALATAHTSADTQGKHEEREDKSLTDRRMLPLAKKLLDWNTPDKQGDKTRNYIIVTAATALDDNADHVAKLVETVLAINPKATVDFVVCGDASGNPVTINGARRTDVASVEGVDAALTAILRDRVNAAPAAVAKPVAAAPAIS